MTREIKFRYFDKEQKKIYYDVQDTYDREFMPMNGENDSYILMQYTGLKDKNGINFIFEMDIIDSEGLLVGNYYENEELLKNSTNLLIQGFGTEAWCTTNKKAMDRGCKYS